jgi:hypothetical protein
MFSPLYQIEQAPRRLRGPCNHSGIVIVDRSERRDHGGHFSTFKIVTESVTRLVHDWPTSTYNIPE